MIKKWHRKFHRSLSEKVFLDAQHLFVSDDVPRPGFATFVARVMAVCVLMTPVLFGGLGAFFIWWAFPSPVGFLFGGAAIGAAIYLRPRRARTPSPLNRREDLPVTFAFVDEISDALGAPRITGIYLDESLNAFVSNSRGEVTLGIGALLWLGLTDDEKRALLGHEMAHLVNKDPSRGTLLWLAQQTMEGWGFLLSDPVILNHEQREYYSSRASIYDDIAVGISEVVIGAITYVIERFSYFEQQKAEYLADALSMRAAGREASMRLLSKLALAGQSVQYGRDLTFATPLRGVELLEHIAAPLRDATQEELQAALVKTENEGSAVDSTHPPTHYRMSFLKCLPDPEVIKTKQSVSKMDAELQPAWQELGESWRLSLEVQ